MFVHCIIFFVSSCILLFLGILVHVPLTNGAPWLAREYVGALKGYLMSTFVFVVFPFIFGLVYLLLGCMLAFALCLKFASHCSYSVVFKKVLLWWT